MGKVSDFIFGGSKITADGDCSHEIKRRLLLGRKFMTNLDGILKIRDITLQTKVSLVKAVVFPVVMYGCESWTMKKAECRRIDAFELWCWRRLLRARWTARRSNQASLKKIRENKCSNKKRFLIWYTWVPGKSLTKILWGIYIHIPERIYVHFSCICYGHLSDNRACIFHQILKSVKKLS